MCGRSRKIVSSVLLIVIACCAACENAEFRKQIGDFQTAMNDSRSAVETYYQEMNQFEKDVYMIRREVDATKQFNVAYPFENGSNKRLIVDDRVLYVNGPFPTESIQARMDALRLIALYGNRLAELAGTDSPATFASNTAALGVNIVKLSGTFSKLANGGMDRTAASYIGPVSTLVSIVGRLFLERKRDKELVAAIQEATPRITAVTTQLRDDFEEVLVPQQRSGQKGIISVLVGYYNDERVKPNIPLKDRQAILAKISGAIHTYELFTASNPKDMVQSMEDANQALLAYANSGRKNEDFVQVVARIGEFRDRAQEVLQAVREIREIRRKLRNEN
jgi:predicted nucleotide-binding protein (sugar kinase/HSP70/actin superfamily)